MRVKRARKVRKYLRYYRTCHGFRAPYKVRLATPSTRLAEPAFANLERRAAAVSPAGFPPTVHARPLSPPAERCPSRADLERTRRGDRMPRASRARAPRRATSRLSAFATLPAHNLTDPCDPNIAANETNDE